MTIGAFSQSTLGSFHQSPLGARETYAQTLKLFDSDGTIVALSPVTLATEGVIGHLPWPHLWNPSRRRNFVSVGGDHTTNWLTVYDTDSDHWDLYECAPESGRAIRYGEPFFDNRGSSFPAWNVGGDTDVIWLLGNTTIDPATPTQRLAMLSPDDWRVVRLSEHTRFSEYGFISRMGGTGNIVYWGHSGAGFWPVPQIGVISPRTFEVLRSRDAPPYTRYPSSGWRLFVLGVDGDDDHMWVLTYRVNSGEQRDKYHLYELDPSDLSIRRHREWDGFVTQPGRRWFLDLGAN